MDPRRVTGEPVQIVKINDDPDDHSFFLDEDALNRILLQDNGALKDKPMCIVSVAGKTVWAAARTHAVDKDLRTYHDTFDFISP